MGEHVQKIVEMHGSNKRLDVFLTEVLENGGVEGYSRTSIRRSIEQGLVAVNAVPELDPSRRLRYGDRVDASLALKEASIAPNSQMDIPVLFENEHIIVIDKPAGIQMHPSSTERLSTVVNWALAHFPPIALVGEDALRAGVVHRLDRNTSGVLVLAKTALAFSELKSLFQNRQVQKVYHALVFGHVPSAEGEITFPLTQRVGTLKRMAVRNPGAFHGTMREAFTAYELRERFQDFDLLALFPRTGRTHQIRVHLAALGHPVVGDHLYGGRKAKGSTLASRQLLHASQLSFELFGEQHAYRTQLPADFQNAIASLPPYEAVDAETEDS